MLWEINRTKYYYDYESNIIARTDNHFFLSPSPILSHHHTSNFILDEWNSFFSYSFFLFPTPICFHVQLTHCFSWVDVKNKHLQVVTATSLQQDRLRHQRASFHLGWRKMLATSNMTQVIYMPLVYLFKNTPVHILRIMILLWAPGRQTMEHKHTESPSDRL